jgi:hypothetical protein
LGKNSGLVESLILTSSASSCTDKVLGALAAAAKAAAAAGHPLPLHTLRVFGDATYAPYGPDLRIMARLLAALPQLRCLQLDVSACKGSPHHLMKPLERATQLQDLYIIGPGMKHGGNDRIARALPVSLKRLSFQTGDRISSVPDLSHLSNLAFLHLERFLMQDTSFSAQLPAGLQELEVVNIPIPLSELQGEGGILTRFSEVPWNDSELQELARFDKIKTLSYVEAERLARPEVCTALQQLPALSDLETFTDARRLDQVQLAAYNLAALRRLSLKVLRPQGPPQLAPLTQLTRLAVSSFLGGSSEEQRRAWVAQLGRMAGLRWLTVPAELLAFDQAWLGGLPQLQVLMLGKEEQYEGEPELPLVLPQVVEWLEGCSPQALPPRLLLLGVTGMTPEQAAAWQVRRRLQQRLASSGCEVVVGVDLDEVADPVKQLAGLPVALQQALA